jgi:sortase A
MTRDNAVRGLEHGLLTVGIALGAWCAAVLVESRFHNAVTVGSPLTVTQTVVPALPGDAHDATGDHLPSPQARTAGSLLGRLEAPSVRMSTNIFEGSDDGTLSRGAGHIEDTPFPGQPGNIGIAGHRDTIFRPLRDIKVGDPLRLTTADRTYRYRISQTLIVGPDDVYVLDPTAEPTLTLVTCYPFNFVGHAPQRFIVHAALEGEDVRNTRPGEWGRPRDSRR